MQTFKLELTDEQMGIVARALAELPYRVSAQLIVEINRQITPQMSQRQMNGQQPTEPANVNQ